ncbi:hypothetical protein ACYRFT_01365 [Listeria kieliensis]
MKFNTSDLIQLVGIIASFTLSAVAIWQSRKSIKLTEKSILEANRANVVIYLDFINTMGTIHEYLVIKNLGASSATIEEIKINKELKLLNGKNSIFSQSTPFLLAPNQSFSTCIKINAFDNPLEIYKFNVTYYDSIAQYSTEFIINENLANDILFPKTTPSKSKTVEQILSYTTEEILRRHI